MKKTFLSLAILALAVFACQNNDEATPNQEATVDMSDFFVYTSDDVSAKSTKETLADKCYSMKVLNRQLQENPGLEQRMFEIEKHTRTLIANKGVVAKRPGGGGTTPPPPTPYADAVVIPVIINILEDPAHPVTQANIKSQIDILNLDFNNQNPNSTGVPSLFSGLVANVNITFTLAGVNRKASTKATWGTRDAMKSATKGGINATDPANNLNIWVCEIGGGILGYAQFPGGTLATDGVVIGSDFLGENTAGGVYGHGRTATHEIGHWLNLRHIWGDGGCSVDDFVLDTPTSDRSNFGCPGETIHCGSIDMTMNYMDYTDDNCMYMFTPGQNDRIRTIFGAGGSRETFVN